MTGFIAPPGNIPDAPARLADMCAGQPSRPGPAPRGRWLLHDNPFLVAEGLAPTWTSDGELCILWDGRLDNRDELGADPDVSDAAVVAAVLSRDRARIADLVGDFVVLAWWPRERRLWIARDAIGVRPCYFAAEGGAVYWGDTLEAVRRGTTTAHTLNDAVFAEFLTSAPASLDETPLSGIHRLPPGQCLEVTPAGHTCRPYWRLEVFDERRQSPGDAVEEFRARFTSAVRARLRDVASPCFQLSGGLDSSSVVGVATRLCGVERPATFSLVYPELPPADESGYIREAEQFCNAIGVHHQVRRSRGRGLEIFAGAVQWGDLPELGTGEPLTAPLLAKARAAGHHVMFTGLGGDEWLTGSRFRMASLLRRGRLWAAWQYSREYRTIRWLDPGAAAMWRAGIVPNLPPSLKQVFRLLRGAPPAPAWVRPEFAERVNLSDRMQAAYRRGAGIDHPVVRESVVRFGSGDSLHLREAAVRAAANAGIELRHPFFDRRLVQFLIALPDDLRLRHGVHRWIQRTALADCLAPRIARRLDKPDQDALIVDALAAAEPEAHVHDLRVVDRGWVDPHVARGLWAVAQRAPGSTGPAGWRAAFGLWQVLAAEALVRALDVVPPRSTRISVPPLTRCVAQ